MQENARQGFWNGSVPPFGYRAVEAERRGQKVKKVLAIDDAEAQVVRRIFDLALGRAGMPLGVKAIVNELNGAGCQHRGKPFHISAVHRILTAATYTGVHHFNRHEAKTGRSKEPDQWIAVTMPQIIPAEDFELVQSSLKARSPKRMPPRVVGNPTLLTGIARCATCGSGMTLRTGKSGRYRYYTCAGCAQKGKTACLGRSISMAALDGMILEHLADKLFTPERLRVMLDAYIARSAEADSQRRERLAHARRAVTEAQGKISRLLDMVEQGLMNASDPTLKERLDTARPARQAPTERAGLLEAAAGSGAAAITEERLAQLSTAIQGVLANGDPAFRKAYMRFFVEQVVVDHEEIRNRGPIAMLAKAATAEGPFPTAGVVPSFVRQWRPIGEGMPARYEGQETPSFSRVA